MNNKPVKSLNVFAVTTMLLLAAAAASAQTTFSNALMSLSPGPVTYWPLQETTRPPASYVETNLGSLGAVANAYYASTNVQGQYQLGGLINGGFTFNGINGDSGGVGAGFNGTSAAFMVVPTTDNRVSLPAGQPFSVEAWIFPTTQGVKASIMSQTGPAGQGGLSSAIGSSPTTNAAGWSLNINYMPRWGTTSPNLNNLLGFSFHVFNGVGNVGAASGAEADAPNYFFSNQWYHVVGVFDGTNCTVYVDGTNDTLFSQPINGSFAPDTWDPLMFGYAHALDTLGGNQTTPPQYTGGMLDLAIYTNALTFQQVSNDYAYGTQSGVSGSYTNWVMTQNKPYMFWQLSAPQYTVPATNTYPQALNYGSDNDPNINAQYQPGTVPGVAGPSYSGMGSFTNAVAINGLNSAVMAWTNASSLSNPLNETNKPLSVLFWFKGNQADTEERFQGLVSHGSSGWRMSMDQTNRLRWAANGSPELISTFGYNDGNWHFVAGVYNNAGTVATGTNYIYVDGRLDTSVTNLSTQASTITNNGIILGGDPSFIVTNLIYSLPPQNYNPAQRYFAGSIAHVAYFTNALSASQILNLYTNAVPNQAPYIIAQPVTGRTLSGSTNNFAFIFFGVIANGTPALGYQWYFNSSSNYAGATQLTDGTKYQGSQTLQVTVSNLVNSDAGFYYVVVTNNSGSVTSLLASLVVDSSPVVTAQTPSTTFTMFTNQTQLLTVTAAGQNPLTYQWFTNGVADTTAGTNPTYSAVGIQTANTETFYCQVTNINGSTNSATVTETLMALPPSLLNSPYSSNVLAFGATGYWPLHEHEAQPLLGVGNIETNYGTWGAIGNGYYEDWASPGIVNHRSLGAIAGDTNPGTTFYSSEGGDGLVVPHWTKQLTLGSNLAPFAMEAWVKPFSANISGVGTYMVILGQGGGNSLNNSANKSGFDLQYGGSSASAAPNTFGINVWNGATSGNTYEQRTFPNYPPGSWYHIFCFWSGSNETFYVNGQFATVQNPNAFDNPQILNPDVVSPFTVGGGRWGNAGMANAGLNSGNGTFNGSIDEVAFYTNITTQIQAAGIAARDYTAGTSVSSNYFNTISSNQPALYYRMDAPGYVQPAPSAMTCVLTNYGTVAQNGVYVPSAVPGSAAGPNVNGVFTPGFMDTNAFQGNSVMSFMDAGFNSQWSPVTTNAFSFSIWAKGQPVDARSFGSQMLSDNDQTVRGSINAAGQFQIHGNVDVIPGNNVNDGNWHHMVMAVQPGYTNGIFFGFTNYLYIDGVLAKAQAAAGTNNPSNNGLPLETLIGDEWGDTNPVTQGNGGRSFFGALSEAAFFYGTVLSSNQVAALYNAGEQPPVILISPVSGTATASLPYTGLNVSASGAQPLFYQWYSNSVAIGGDPGNNFLGQITNGVAADPLTINPVQLFNAGTYYAIVSNSFGMATSAMATLTIVTSPGITNYTPFAYTNPFSLYAGVTPIFSVSTVGAPNLGYYWYTNGTQDGSIANTSSTYTNYNVQAAFSNYCVVSNSYGIVTSIVWAASIIPDPTAPYPQWVLSNNPAAYWRLNETNPGVQPDSGPDNGVVANDYAGGNDGLYTNVTLGNLGYAPTIDPSDFSVYAGFLTPANADVCAINGPDFTTPNGINAEFTVSVWVYPSANENGNAGILAKGLFNQEEYNLDCGGNNAGFRFETRQSGSQNVSAGSNIPLGTGANTNLNKWYQVVAVVDQANTNASLYVNGQLNAVAVITNNTGIFNSAATPLSFGARSSINPSYVFGGDDQQFYGYISDVAIYRHALSSNQVLDSYVHGTPTPPFLLSKLVATNFASAGATLVVSNNPVLVAGSPGITNWWTLLNNGSPVSNIVTGVTSSNSSLLDASLVVSNVPANWNGDQLELNVSNAFGGTNYFANLVVSSKPQIVVDIPPALALVAGRYFTYSPQLIGSLPIHFQWYSNTVAVVGQTNSTYSFQAAGSGTNNYQYIVTNIFGSATSVVSSVTVFSSYQAFVLSNGPAAYWPLDEGPDDTNGDDNTYAQDLAGTNTMQYTNAVIGLPGLPGDPFTVAQFATFGRPSFARELGATANPDMGQLATLNGNNGEFSVECWVNGPAGQALNSRIVDCGYFFHEEWALDLGTTTPASAFRFTLRGANETEYDARATIQADGNWHDLVGVCDGANGFMAIYIDGQLAATNNFDTGFSSGVGIDERPEVIAIGAGDNSSTESGTYNAQWTGKISDVAIYTNVLSPAQVLAHYQSVTAGIYPIPVVTTQLPLPGENQFNLYASASPTYLAVATGLTPLSYQWYSNGVAVANATNTTFQMNKLQVGTYTNYCIVTNISGSGTSMVWNASVITAPAGLFTATIMSNNPTAYWRLNEPLGSSLASDYAGGANGSYGSSTSVGQPGVNYAGLNEQGVTMNNTAPGVAGGCVTSAGVVLNTNAATFLCWINASTLTETNPSGLIFTRSGNNVAGDQIGGVNYLDYTWSNNPATYNYGSGLQVPANKWMLVALTTTPTNAILYLINTNGFNSATNPVANLPESFQSGVFLGADPLATNRIFQGTMNEAAIFNYTMSASQLQQLYSAATNASLSIATNPTNITFSLSGNLLTLSWPSDHTGWQLQAQTNRVTVGIATNWVNVSGTTTTNKVIIPINLTNGCVFYRLQY